MRASHPDVDVDFLAAPVSAFRRFRRDGQGRFGLFDTANLNARVLDVVERINGTPWRRVSDFSHVAVVGFINGHQKALELIAASGIDDFRPPPGPHGPLISAAAFRAQCVATAAARAPTQFAGDFGEARLAVIPAPVRSERLIGTGNDFEAVARRLQANPQGVLAARAIFEKAAANEAEKVGVTYIPQDEASLTDCGLSRAEYSDGALRLDADMTGEDYTHLNADYGRLMMGHILAWFLNGRTAFT